MADVQASKSPDEIESKPANQIVEGNGKNPLWTIKSDFIDHQRTGYYAVLLMLIVGCLSGVLINVALWASTLLSIVQVNLLKFSTFGPFYLVMTTSTLCGLAAYICKCSNRVAAVGSGIPEVKALLTNDLHASELPMIVSSRIGFTRLVALLMALGSGLSIGSAAPLVHMTVCNAYTIMKLSPDFGCLLENSNMMRQIFNASAAAGMAACFNCPLGGVLFSIEVTSTHYLLVNYWRSFMAAAAGTVLFNLILWSRGTSDSRPFPLDYIQNPYSLWELPLFFLLGIVGGGASFLYLKMQQTWFLFIRRTNIAHPVAMAAGVGAVSALLLWTIGSYTDRGLTPVQIVNDLLNSGEASELSKYPHVNRIGGLCATLVVRWCLTIVSSTLRIPAGFFTPMIMLGAIIGRIFGRVVQACVGESVSIYLPGYALVGACAFASGTTHTISAAVVMLESTGQLSMFLPCLIGAVLGEGVVKGNSVSLYNQGVINKGLESFEQLLRESGGSMHTANDMMDQETVFIARNCRISDLMTLMEHPKLATFGVVDDLQSKRLIGSIARKDVYQYLKRFYTKHGLVAFVRQVLPEDTKQDDYRIARQKKMESRSQWLRAQNVLPGEMAEHVGERRPMHATLLGRLPSFRSLRSTGSADTEHTALPTQDGSNQPDSPRLLEQSCHSNDEEMGNMHHHHTGVSDLPPLARSLDVRSRERQDSFACPPGSEGMEDGVELPPRVIRSTSGNRLAAAENATPGGVHPTPPNGLLPLTSDHVTLSGYESGIAREIPMTRRRGNSWIRKGSGTPTSVMSDATYSGDGSLLTRLAHALHHKHHQRASLAHLDTPQLASAKLLLQHPVDILADDTIPVHTEPFTVRDYSSIDQVILIFSGVKVNCVFVVGEDKALVGTISQEALMLRLKERKQ